MRLFVALLGTLLVTPCGADDTPRKPWPQEPTSYRGIEFGQAKDIAKKRVKLGFCSRTELKDEMCASSLDLAGVAVNDYLTFVGQKGAAKFVGADMLFAADSYETVRTAFLTKYGEPTTTERTPVETRMGMKSENEVLTWEGPLVTVHLIRYNGKITESGAAIKTRAQMERVEKARADTVKAGADSF